METAIDLQRAPIMFYWEMTRACDLACRHCRAEAVARRDPHELSTAEGMRLLEEIAAFKPAPPHLVLTGGDPLQRPDVFALIERAVELGLKVSVTPSGTPRSSNAVIDRLQDAGVTSLAFSLDGSTALKHDHIRGVVGSYAETLRALRHAVAQHISTQVNTLISEETVDDLPAVYDLVRELGAVRWSVFFLIQVGRGAVLHEVSPARAEDVMDWILTQSKNPNPIIKTTEAPHYRRVAAQRRADREQASEQASAVRRGWAVRDGSGVIFVSHTGDVYPAGFLPVRVGNVRDASVVDVYRHNDVMQRLRQPDSFTGRCGVCEFRHVCGGSRARAYAATGDMFAADPLCTYQPKSMRVA